eukprot:6202260-Pleurochrysis_carterae.AAC.4
MLLLEVARCVSVRASVYALADAGSDGETNKVCGSTAVGTDVPEDKGTGTGLGDLSVGAAGQP